MSTRPDEADSASGRLNSSLRRSPSAFVGARESRGPEMNASRVWVFKVGSTTSVSSQTADRPNCQRPASLLASVAPFARATALRTRHAAGT
jgi:hypothetical protein